VIIFELWMSKNRKQRGRNTIIPAIVGAMLNDAVSDLDIVEPASGQFFESKLASTKVIEAFPSHRLKRMSWLEFV